MAAVQEEQTAMVQEVKESNEFFAAHREVFGNLSMGSCKEKEQFDKVKVNFLSKIDDLKKKIA